MKVEIAVQTHFFQRRLCWMLSSILQADKPEGLELIVNLAYSKRTGNPTTESVINHFRKEGLTIKTAKYRGIKEFQYRGLTRNRQLKESTSDWMFFADTDMCYPVDFFSALYRLLDTKFKDSPKCLYGQRFSTLLPETQAIVNDERLEYPCTIPDACAKIKKLPGKLKANIGAGYCQIVNIAQLRSNHGGLYQPEGKKIDWSWEKKRQKAKSDMQFRRRLGRKPMPLPLQYHIQHERDSDYGRHVEIQR